ncbi:tRNA 5-methoxyuridine(34)/uridine 5-oxyacetic acid(34) synthase CmoB [Brumicola nitratireducens]|uniref:tRNA U34 carboxymethyltransferase n=1 Tax=Glaciecola nitratireducens (strain JCM 12485 / KCTC 12276 / FR1064) TaxID=1085623 RepID=G4QGR7_GLANF|nr:tRNA 5-methoxyuridine(34)/uridine 5-oxyacetic acid(34) synthase CmoB [Glaciecola nitratireducens]AEP29862.1 putative methyltransferase with S-adenosyl-L-methionine-dependent methyltransferase domain [Glaciecola nitratireducens FR1064]
MNWKSALYAELIGTELEKWAAHLIPQLEQWENIANHGDRKKWQKQLQQLPAIEADKVDLKSQVSISQVDAFGHAQTAHIESVLKQFMPWRKGPFHFFGIDIDTEWRSDWKWDRVLPHIAPLAKRKVLDVGCGSGYHLFRMLGEDAKLVIGIDPTELFFYQFQVFKKYLPKTSVHYVPLGIEDMPTLNAFDTVFSMGVLYHRRDPIEFLYQLKNQLVSGGQLVLETIVIDGNETSVLMPGERYAQMRNVWFLPSSEALMQWLSRVGFVDIKKVDENTTTVEEQRTTDWMTNHSLADFLDPTNRTLTIEGYPAPKRAVFTAIKK